MSIKHDTTTLVTLGEGTVLMRIGLNEKNEGILRMYSTSHPRPIGRMRTFYKADVPPDVDLECPDIAIRVTNESGLTATIKTLKALRKTMREAKDA